MLDSLLNRFRSSLIHGAPNRAGSAESSPNGLLAGAEAEVEDPSRLLHSVGTFAQVGLGHAVEGLPVHKT